MVAKRYLSSANTMTGRPAATIQVRKSQHLMKP